jgi:Flp pilus assembly protein TadG
MQTVCNCRGILKAGWRNRSGQSLVEMALIFPILLTFLVGAADLARVAHVSIVVSNAAKAGAQYGVQNGFTAEDNNGIIAAAAAEAPTLTLNTVPTYTCVCSDGTASTCANTDCTNSHMEQTLTVSTSTTVTPLIHLPRLPRSFTVKGEAVQRCLQ